MKYILYARKSSEGEDRQVQSIDDQVQLLKELAKNLNLNIIEVCTEAKSAKAPHVREVFNSVLDKIQSGEADAILCWHLDRLSRNPVDSGTLSWMLQTEKLQEIQTATKKYQPNDNVLLFSVESGMANQFVRDLSKNTKRGLYSKLEKGWWPSSPPLGYKNERIEKTIIKDPERFDLIKKMWEMLLSGHYTVGQIRKIANEEWGFLTRKTKRLGGRPLGKSTLYAIFSNIFYTGKMFYHGEYYDGQHDAMITEFQFDKAQLILGRKGRPRPQTHFFAYTGMMICGECGCFITAEKKTKLMQRTKEIKEYNYYHCTNKKKDHKCKQKSIRLEDLEIQIDQELSKITILPEFKEWALEALNESNDGEIKERSDIYEMQQKNARETQKQLDNLTKMRYRELINDDEFLKEKTSLQESLKKIQKELQGTESRADEWLELTEKVFDFATYARAAFANGTLQEKKEILGFISPNIILKDKQLEIEPQKWFSIIENEYPVLEAEYLRLEPQKQCEDKTKNEAINLIRSTWLRGSDSNRRPIG